MPRMRGRLYSSCASSTCSFPSALTACWAKMSRISCVRSTTRASSAFSSALLLHRVELVVDEEHVCSRVREDCFSSASLPLPTYVRGSGPLPLLHELGDRLDARGARELAELAELVLGVGPLRENREHEAALGLRARVRIGLTGRHRDG